MVAGMLFLAAASSQMNLVQAARHSSSSVNAIPSPHQPCEKTFYGPLAAGLQVTGGSKLKRAKNKIQTAARRMRQSYRERLVLEPTAALTTATTTTSQPNKQSQQKQPQHHSEVAATISRLPLSSNTEIPEVKQVFIPIRPPTTESVAFLQAKPRTQAHVDGSSRKAILFMSLLAIQFGIQPILVKNYTPRGICKSSVVLTQELVKGVIALSAFYGSTNAESRKLELSRLTIRSFLIMAGIPAAIYTVQNLASLLAYQNLEALTFNVLNQTKTLSAALCCYLVMGKKQTKIQSLSLVILLSSALVIEKVLSFESIVSFLGNGITMPRVLPMGRRFTHGVIPVLFASLLSGLAGSLTQKNLQGVSKSPSVDGPKLKPINPYLFSMELTVASVALLMTSLLFSADGKQIFEDGFFHLWTPKTIIPILTNSFGGILVGLVTKYAGSVRKGFALILGILVSGLLQAGSHGISASQIVGGLLVAISLYMHSSAGNHSTSKLAKKGS